MMMIMRTGADGFGASTVADDALATGIFCVAVVNDGGGTQYSARGDDATSAAATSGTGSGAVKKYTMNVVMMMICQCWHL